MEYWGVVTTKELSIFQADWTEPPARAMLLKAADSAREERRMRTLKKMWKPEFVIDILGALFAAYAVSGFSSEHFENSSYTLNYATPERERAQSGSYS